MTNKRKKKTLSNVKHYLKAFGPTRRIGVIEVSS